MHFAAHIVVHESIKDPIKYYSNNISNSVSLLELCVEYEVKKFILSSTAAVYKIPKSVREIIREAEILTGVDFPVIEGKKREGDPPILTAGSKKIKKELRWNQKYNDLPFIIKTAWDWEIKFLPAVTSTSDGDKSIEGR
jgi:UDP-glucose 4-epimerase